MRIVLVREIQQRGERAVGQDGDGAGCAGLSWCKGGSAPRGRSQEQAGAGVGDDDVIEFQALRQRQGERQHAGGRQAPILADDLRSVVAEQFRKRLSWLFQGTTTAVSPS